MLHKSISSGAAAMRRLTISTFLAGIVGAIVLALLLLSGGHTAQATTGVNDPVTSATSGTSTTAVTATADPAITAASATSSAPSQCLPQSPPAPGCASAPVVTIGQPQTVTVHKT